MIKTLNDFIINGKSFGSIQYLYHSGYRFINLTDNRLNVITSDDDVITIPPATKSKTIKKIYEFLYGPDIVVKQLGDINIYGRPHLREEYKTFYVITPNNRLKGKYREDIFIPVKVEVDDDMAVFNSNKNRFSTMIIDDFSSNNDTYAKYKLKVNE